MDKNKIKKLLLGELSWKRWFMSIIYVFIMLYCCLVLFGCFYADSLMFPVPDPSYSDYEDIIKLPLKDGTKISLSMHKVDNPLFYILYSHGNAVDLGRINSYLDVISKNLNCSVISYDYPGYGTSDGKPSEDSVLAASDASYEFLKSMGVKDSRIIIWGRSVGSGAAVHLAYKYPVAGLILQSPFKSAFTVITRFPILPFDKFKNINIIDKIKCPLLVIHGKQDRVIPFYHGEAIYESAVEPKYKLWIDGAGHNNLVLMGGDKYWNIIKDFLGNKLKKDVNNPGTPSPNSGTK